jgi:hypothetical protein
LGKLPQVMAGSGCKSVWFCGAAAKDSGAIAGAIKSAKKRTDDRARNASFTVKTPWGVKKVKEVGFG